MTQFKEPRLGTIPTIDLLLPLPIVLAIAPLIIYHGRVPHLNLRKHSTPVSARVGPLIGLLTSNP